jgi:hypothetical protein
VRVERLGPWYQACNVAYPRELLARLGGFDADAYPRSGEDTDLAWRAFELGTPATWAPDALVYHAVNRLGAVGKIRVAARWDDSMRVYARWPELRHEVFTKRVFWKLSHYLLVRALVGLLLPRRLRPLKPYLAFPYLVHLLERGRVEGGGPVMAPWYVLLDVVEVTAVARGALRLRKIFL